ncbi:MAG: hypothetical protein K0U78_17275 [Actinomycetia bacterium]|nr:hypothetical protein [Actinomycetes bacterium]
MTSAPRPRNRYGEKAGGERGVIGVETDESGTPLVNVVTTLVSRQFGWVEATTVVGPEPLLNPAPEVGSVIELSGDLKLAVRGGDYGATKATLTGASGVKLVGSAIDAVTSISAPGTSKAAS